VTCGVVSASKGRVCLRKRKRRKAVVVGWDGEGRWIAAAVIGPSDVGT